MMKTVSRHRGTLSESRPGECASPGAFTLIEVIVVVFLVGVLMSILLPLALQARGRAHSSTCLNNLHQLHHACAQYAQDYDGLIPPYQNSISAIKYKNLPAVQTTPETGPIKAALRPYTGTDDSLWHCPIDPPGRSSGLHGHLLTSYFTSSAVSICIAYGLILDMTGTPPASQIHKSPPTAAALRSADPSHSPLLGEVIGDMQPAYTHNGRLNFVYFDGHVQAIPWREAPL